MQPTSPFDMMRLWFEMSRLSLEAGSVIWMRTTAPPSKWGALDPEAIRMVMEKPTAFLDASQAASRAAMRGAAPDKVISAAIAPLSREAGSNRRRLSNKTKRKAG